MNLLRLSRRFHAVAVLAVALAAASCCHKDDPDPYNRNVLIFYECGFNDLYSYLSANMDRQLIRGYTTSDIEKKVPKSFIPGKNGNVVLIYSKIAKNTRYEPVESTLKRIYVSKGNLVTEVLRTFDSSVSACDPSTMREVMNYAKEQFPAKGYGLVFSSHGSGWLPEGYYYSPSKFEREHAGELPASARRAPGKTWNIPVERIEDDPYRHMVRSVGEELSAGGGRSQMSIEEFAGGIPYHLDYILFDMCFSGGVELAYGLKDKADYIIGSPAEVLADGMFDYSTILRYLLFGSSADLPGLARNSFMMYDTVSSQQRHLPVGYRLAHKDFRPGAPRIRVQGPVRQVLFLDRRSLPGQGTGLLQAGKALLLRPEGHLRQERGFSLRPRRPPGRP